MKIEDIPIRDRTLKVLDYGHCRLCESMGTDLSIVRNARVSYDADWRAGEDEGSDTRLINYLMRNNHTTPFESVVFTFDIKAPIFVVRQWHRHRIGWSYNELSARYRELPEECYVPDIDRITTQSIDNKQMSSDIRNPHAAYILGNIKDNNRECFNVYRNLIANECPREIARGVLPLNVYTHMFCTVNLKALFHFCELRLHKHAQYEIRQYARSMLELAAKIVPVAVMSFYRNKITEDHIQMEIRPCQSSS